MPRRKKEDELPADQRGPPRCAANLRERTRMRVLSRAFGKLKLMLPWVPPDTKLSKLDTLRLATSYISHLQRILDAENNGDKFTQGGQQQTHENSLENASRYQPSSLVSKMQNFVQIPDLSSFLYVCKYLLFNLLYASQRQFWSNSSINNLAILPKILSEEFLCNFLSQTMHFMYVNFVISIFER